MSEERREEERKRKGREEVGEGEGKGERKTPTVNRLYKHIPIPIHTCVHTPGHTCTVKVESQSPMYIGQHSLKHSVRNGKASWLGATLKDLQIKLTQ